MKKYLVAFENGKVTVCPDVQGVKLALETTAIFPRECDTCDFKTVSSNDGFDLYGAEIHEVDGSLTNDEIFELYNNDELDSTEIASVFISKKEYNEYYFKREENAITDLAKEMSDEDTTRQALIHQVFKQFPTPAQLAERDADEE